VHTTWRTDVDAAHLLDLLQQRIAAAEDVTAVDRDGGTLVVRSLTVPTWAYLLSTLLTPMHGGSTFLRARSEKVLRVTAMEPGLGLQLDGDANAAVSEILVKTSHELFPERLAAWDDDD